jgi:hypothetical protein
MAIRPSRVQTELSHSQPRVWKSALAVTGHSTTNLPNCRLTFETGYSAMGAGGRALNDRLRPGRTGTPDPLPT